MSASRHIYCENTVEGPTCLRGPTNPRSKHAKRLAWLRSPGLTHISTDPVRVSSKVISRSGGQGHAGTTGLANVT